MFYEANLSVFDTTDGTIYGCISRDAEILINFLDCFADDDSNANLSVRETPETIKHLNHHEVRPWLSSQLTSTTP